MIGSSAARSLDSFLFSCGSKAEVSASSRAFISSKRFWIAPRRAGNPCGVVSITTLTKPVAARGAHARYFDFAVLPFAAGFFALVSMVFLAAAFTFLGASVAAVAFVLADFVAVFAFAGARLAIFGLAASTSSSVTAAAAAGF